MNLYGVFCCMATVCSTFSGYAQAFCLWRLFLWWDRQFLSDLSVGMEDTHARTHARTHTHTHTHTHTQRHISFSFFGQSLMNQSFQIEICRKRMKADGSLCAREEEVKSEIKKA